MLVSRRGLLKLTLGVGAAGFSSAAYGFAIEPGLLLHIQRYRIRPATWPRNRPLRIVVLADPHLGEPYMPLDRWAGIVDTATALAPDLIVMLGDYPPGHRFVTRPVAMDDFARVSRGLRARLGVYSILGNHDWWADEKAQLAQRGPVDVQRALERHGIRVLSNDAVRIAGDDGPFWLLGLGDQLAFLRPHGGATGIDDLAGTLAGVHDDAPAILLAHEPDIFPRVPQRVALTLCGHTHGGQVRLFGYSPIVPSRYGNRYAYGHVAEAGRHLVVSGGLGCSNLPVRFGVPPEITVVDLA